MKWFALAAAFGLAGCMETSPKEPSPAEKQLTAACQAGDNAACGTLLTAEQRRKAQEEQLVMAWMGMQAANNQSMIASNNAMLGAMTASQPVRVQTTCRSYYNTTTCN